MEIYRSQEYHGAIVSTLTRNPPNRSIVKNHTAATKFACDTDDVAMLIQIDMVPAQILKRTRVAQNITKVSGSLLSPIIQ